MRSPWERSRDRRLESQARQLVNECESFLVGRYPSVLRAQGLPVPEWAWLSMLAHAPVDRLVTQNAGVRRRQIGDHLTVLWLGAVALLAQELVMVADRTGCSVEELQHAVILNVELNWRRPLFGASVMGPSRFVEEVRQALSRFRGSSHPQ